MTHLLLALVLSQEPARFIAVEPPPERVARVVWVHGETEAPGLYLTDYQAQLVAARQDECERRLGEAQVEAVKPSIPSGAWVAVGAVSAALLIWLGPPVVEEVGEVFR